MKKIKYIMSALALGLMFHSCDVERFPEGSIELSQSFKKVSDAEYWNNAVYSFLRGRVYGIYSYSTDIQADQLNATQDFGNRNGDLHRWTGFLSTDYTIRDVYRGYYGAINNINTQLQGFDGIVPANSAEKAKMDGYYGDAYLARAFYYLNLTLRFAKAYNASTAATDLSVPLLLVPDLEAKPARGTVEDAYKLILEDIGKAKTLLANKAGAVGASRFNIDVATALEARVKLYMNDFTGALAAAKTLVDGGLYPLNSTKASIQAMWATTNSSEVIFQPKVARPNEMPNSNAPFYGFSAGNNDFRPDFIPSQWVVDMYDNADFRKSVYFVDTLVTMSTVNASEKVNIVYKYPHIAGGLNVDKSTNAVVPKVFRIAEMYLIAAEAAYRSSPSNTADALTYLNALRVSRGLPALSGISGTTLFNEIKNERFRELAFEGFRLDDLKRWNEGFERRAPQSAVLVRSGEEYSSKKVEASDLKFVWGLPDNDVSINPNLDQNEGW